MRLLLSFLALLVETSLVFGTPNEENGIIYDGAHEAAKARHEVRDVGAQNLMMSAVASMLSILRGMDLTADQTRRLREFIQFVHYWNWPSSHWQIVSRPDFSIVEWF